MVKSLEFVVRGDINRSLVLKAIYDACERQFNKIIKVKEKNICLYMELYRKDWNLDKCRNSIMTAIKASRILKNLDKHKFRLRDYKVIKEKDQHIKVRITWNN